MALPRISGSDQQGSETQVQEDHQHDHRQRAADEDVLLDEVDGGIDVLGFVVNLRQLQSLLFQNALVQLRVDGLQSRHHVQHVGSRFAQDIDRDTGFAEAAHESIGLLEAQADLGHVANIHRVAVAHRQQLSLDVLRRAELSQRPHDPPPFALPIITAGRVFILAAQHVTDVHNRELTGRKFFRIDDDL